MTFDSTGLTGLDYEICAYSGSRLQFRGPKCDLGKPYIAFLGATETYGKFVEHPFPTLLAEQYAASPVNLGMINAGVDAYMSEPEVINIAKQADMRIVQVIGALNQTNHYFKVHPRRNDRFVGPRETLKRLFPEVDFAEFHFTKAMLSALRRCSRGRYKMLCDELQKIWLARMTFLLSELGDKTVLLWFATSQPPVDALDDPLDPMLIDASMIKQIRRRASAYVEVVPDTASLEQDRDALLSVLASNAIVQQVMGPNAHLQAAQALQETCNHLMTKK